MIRRHLLGLLALLVGMTALGLAIIPVVALDRPLPFAADRREPPAPPREEPEQGVTLRLKKWSVTIGRGRKVDAADKAAWEAEAALAEQRETDRNRLLKWFTMSAIACALIGLILGPVSLVREHQPILSGSAVVMSFMAIFWQYIVIGIILGVAVAVLMIWLSHFGV